LRTTEKRILASLRRLYPPVRKHDAARHLRYRDTTMHVFRVTQIFAEHLKTRHKTEVLGIGRDLCMLAVASALYLNYHFMQVLIEINNLPSVIVFVR
jgi:hypothetical protein